MFLLVSGRHVGAHLGGHQHGVSIQISINLEKTFLRISPIKNIAVTWILARVFAYLPSFYFQILDLIYCTVLIFYFDLFWMAWHWKPAICLIFLPVVEFHTSKWKHTSAIDTSDIQKQKNDVCTMFVRRKIIFLLTLARMRITINKGINSRNACIALEHGSLLFGVGTRVEGN